MFAVIIPYYQRQPGILAAALRSVAAQDVAVPINVYIADDESPSPPEAEVAAVAWPSNCHPRILKQKNGGPGAARNLALDALDNERYIAFLDSDDCWSTDHLSAALLAFERGYDVYTSDWCIDDAGTRAHAHFYGDRLRLKALGEPDWASELEDDLINYSVCGPIGLLSVLVVRRERIGALRFDTSLRTSGEDGLFVTTLASTRPRMLVSNRIDSTRGRGVNIFSEGGWNSRAAFLRSLYYLKSRLAMKPLMAGFPLANERLRERMVVARQGVWDGLLACLRRRERIPREFFALLVRDPGLLASAPAALAKIIGKRLR